MCSCKNEAHVANYCSYKLSRDKKNPGMIWQITKKKVNLVSHKKFAHDSQQDVFVTGNHTVTQHH